MFVWRTRSLLHSCAHTACCSPVSTAGHSPFSLFSLSSSLDCDEGSVSPGLMNENTSHTAGTETGKTCYCFRWVAACGLGGVEMTEVISSVFALRIFCWTNVMIFIFFFFLTYSNVEMSCWMWICLALQVGKCKFSSPILVKVQWVTAIKHCALWSFGPYTHCLKNALYGVLWWKVTGFKIPGGVINVVPRGGRPDRVQYISSHIAHTKNT